MTLNDVLQELIQILSSKDDDTISWELVREWPKNAIEIFQSAGWIKPKESAKYVTCPGCEENCYMPVHVSPVVQGNSIRTFVFCQQRDDMGRIPISLELCQQWQITGNQVAQWIARELSIRGKPKRDKKTNNILIGDVQGKKKTGSLELVCTEPTSLKASGHSLPLIEIIYFKDNQLQIDQVAIINLLDRPPPSDRYNSSIAKREARKLDTQARYKGWQKVYRELKRKHTGRSDNWCAHQIARKPIGKGFSSETIRKNMKN